MAERTHSDGGYMACKLRREAREARRGAIFFDKALARHGPRFDYSQARYWDRESGITVRCVDHDHWFGTTPKQHLKAASGGCEFCRQEIQRAPRTRTEAETTSHFRDVTHPETGETKALDLWAMSAGITPQALNYRLETWGDIAAALTTPKHGAYHKPPKRQHKREVEAHV